MFTEWSRPLSIIIQIVTLALPILLVYTEEKREVNMNLIKHGFLSIAALAVYVVLFVTMMARPFYLFASYSPLLGLFNFPLMWTHGIFGMLGIILGIIMVASWFTEPLADLGCAKTWKLMIPTSIIWALAVASGIAYYLFA